MSIRPPPYYFQSSRRASLDRKLPYTIELTPIVENWYLKDGFDTNICPEHSGCIKFVSDALHPHFGWGLWKLKEPINLEDKMSGSEHELIHVSFDTMQRLSWGAQVHLHKREFRMPSGLWKASDREIIFGDKTFKTNKYTPEVDISGQSEIGFELWNEIRMWAGATDIHYRNMKAVVEYVPETPPEPATVNIRVLNQETGNPVSGAYVAFMSGDQIIRRAHSDDNGWATLTGIDAVPDGLPYDLKIRKNGYEVFTGTIEVYPGSQEFEKQLVPKPTPPTPWWVWPAVGGVVLLGGVTMLPRLTGGGGRRGETIVVK